MNPPDLCFYNYPQAPPPQESASHYSFVSKPHYAFLISLGKVSEAKRSILP